MEARTRGTGAPPTGDATENGAAPREDAEAQPGGPEIPDRADRPERWAERVLREAKERRDEVLDGLEIALSDLKDAEAIIEAVTGESPRGLTLVLEVMDLQRAEAPPERRERRQRKQRPRRHTAPGVADWLREWAPTVGGFEVGTDTARRHGIATTTLRKGAWLLVEEGLLEPVPDSRPQAFRWAGGDVPVERKAEEAEEEPETPPQPPSEPPTPDPDPGPAPAAEEPQAAGERRRMLPGPGTAAEKAARRDAEAAAYVREHGRALASEVRDAVGIPPGSWGGVKERLLSRYGIRLDQHQPPHGGRPLDILVAGDAPDPPEPSAEERPETGPSAEQVRDVVCKWFKKSEGFTPRDVAMAGTGDSWEEKERHTPAVEEHLARFAGERRIVEHLGGGTYKYVRRVEDPHDRGTGRTDRGNPGRAGVGHVEGTGKGHGTRASDPAVRRLLGDVRRAGGDVTGRGGGGTGHFIVEYHGQKRQVPSTPRSASSLESTRKRLREIGLRV